MGSILVTGAAGFIGTNFVRYWVEQHPGDHVVALDALTYAGVRENVEGIDGGHVRAGRHRRPPTIVEQVLEEHAVDRIVNFAAESHNSLAIIDPARVLPHQRVGHPGALRGGPAGRRRALPPRLDVRGVRRPVARDRREVRRGVRLPAAHARTTRPRPAATTWCALLRDLAPADHDHELRQQLRPVPVPGEGHPVLHHTRAAGSAAADVRVDPEPARVDPRPRPLPGDRRDPERRPDRRDVPRRTGVEKSVEQIADTVLSHLGKPESLKTIVPDRPGHDRRYVLDWSKIERELGWEPTRRVGRRDRRDDRLVRRQPRVVGAVARSRARRRGQRLEVVTCPETR